MLRKYINLDVIKDANPIWFSRFSTEASCLGSLGTQGNNKQEFVVQDPLTALVKNCVQKSPGLIGGPGVRFLNLQLMNHSLLLES